MFGCEKSQPRAIPVSPEFDHSSQESAKLDFPLGWKWDDLQTIPWFSQRQSDLVCGEFLDGEYISLVSWIEIDEATLERHWFSLYIEEDSDRSAVHAGEPTRLTWDPKGRLIATWKPDNSSNTGWRKERWWSYNDESVFPAESDRETFDYTSEKITVIGKPLGETKQDVWEIRWDTRRKILMTSLNGKNPMIWPVDDRGFVHYDSIKPTILESDAACRGEGLPDYAKIFFRNDPEFIQLTKNPTLRGFKAEFNNGRF